MKAGLELPGGGLFPNKALVDAYGLDRIGWPTHVESNGGYVWNPLLDPKQNGGVNVMEDVRKNWGMTLFAFRALWGYSGPPEGWAKLLQDDLRRLDMLPVTSGANKHTARQCALDADLEVDDPAWVLACLREVRRLMPGRGLTWSMQPHKGGVISDALVEFINTDSMVTVAPFKYRNNMQPCSESWVRDDLLGRGIRPEKILVYFDRYEEGFNGFLYGIRA